MNIGLRQITIPHNSEFTEAVQILARAKLRSRYAHISWIVSLKMADLFPYGEYGKKGLK
jgi:hypothetical protein